MEENADGDADGVDSPELRLKKDPNKVEPPLQNDATRVVPWDWLSGRVIRTFQKDPNPSGGASWAGVGTHLSSLSATERVRYFDETGQYQGADQRKNWAF